MSADTYQEPVSKLLTYGDYLELSQDSEPNYIERFGLTEQDIPELIRMATDAELNELDSDLSEVWAPLHAWHALGQLRAEAAIEPLIGLFGSGDEYVYEEMPEIFGKIGGAAIPALGTYLADDSQDVWALITAADCLREIASNHPDHRAAAIAALVNQLESYANNDPNLNSTLINNLVLLKAVEAAPLIEQAFTTDEIDEFLTGSWAQIQVDLGLKQKEDFSPEELKPKVPPQLAAFHQNMEKLAKAFDIQTQQHQKPKGFGVVPPIDIQKPKKKKKKK
ncbi:MAG: hypothetical protein NW224_09410 [Leptolyngbyaceae cyanobacterium bins.302]|nr:hypothetical protein [Leptolyngbyaceae cyanobacterium bins.302]